MSANLQTRPRQPMPDAAAVHAIVTGRHGDPFSVLGPHRQPDGAWVVSVFAPDADAVDILDRDRSTVLTRLERIHTSGFFFGVTDADLGNGYRLRNSRGSHIWESADAYAFASTLGDLDVYLLGEGTLTAGTAAAILCASIQPSGFGTSSSPVWHLAICINLNCSTRPESCCR
jgi:hypothetical protein